MMALKKYSLPMTPGKEGIKTLQKVSHLTFTEEAERGGVVDLQALLQEKFAAFIAVPIEFEEEGA